MSGDGRKMAPIPGVAPHLRHKYYLNGGFPPANGRTGVRCEEEEEKNDWSPTVEPNTDASARPSLKKAKNTPVVSMKQWERVASDQNNHKQRVTNRPRKDTLPDSTLKRPLTLSLTGATDFEPTMGMTDHRGRMLYPHQAARLRARQRSPEPVAPAPMRDPDLDVIQIPRPDGTYVSPPPSNPSVSSLGHDNDPLPTFTDDDSSMQVASQTPDIRGKLAPMHQLESHNGKWVDKSFWDASNALDASLANPLYANPWIGDWAKKDETVPVSASFLYEVDSSSHCHSDINTYTGKLLGPVDYPYTAPDYMNEWADSTERQMTRTSNLYIQKKTTKQPRNRRVHAPPGPAPPGYAPPSPAPALRGWTETVASAVAPHSSIHKQIQPVESVQQLQQVETTVTPAETTATDVKPNSSETEYDPYEPLVKCHIRPAGKQDMKGALDIYNWEVIHGDQALDAQLLTLSDFELLLKQHQDAKLPFIVLLSGPHQESEVVGDREDSAPMKKWASMYPQMKLRQPTAEVLPVNDGEILAFGFITVRQPGLAGALNGTGQKTGLIRTFVHHEYRGKKLGEACVDTLLSMVSHRYSVKLNLFRNINKDPVYETARQSAHEFVSIFFERLVPRLETVNETGKAKFVPDHKAIIEGENQLKSRFNFWKVARLDATHRIDPYESASKRDLPQWVDTLVFEHQCHPEGLILGNA